MCGRSSLTKVEKEIEQRFHATFYSEELERYNPLPNYNVAPTHYHPVITNQDSVHIHLYKWGLIPFWAKDEKIGSKLINARVESIAEKPVFKNALKSRRCLVPMDGFYEWKKVNNQKIPYRIVTRDQEIFAAAGLWENWKNSIGEEVHSFTIITLAANKIMSSLHDRMPAILMRDQEKLWLSNDIPPEDLLEMLQPYPDELTKIYRVSEKVNNVRANDPTLIEEVKDIPLPVQGSLFE
ncbi:MAG: SOS response-associated peptidase [Saprospiraceae bacterium]|nr:SOS response-associated peptidase [Saprospiraceae bacterium]